MLWKPNKINYTVVKLSSVISLLNCIGKVCEKVAADMLAYWCEVYNVLHK